MSNATFTWGALEDPDATLRSVQAEPRESPPVVAGRYALGERIGEGGGGTVYAARDLLSGDEVAVKRLHALSDQALDRVLLEVTALRWLRLPGVVRLRDDGPDEGGYFFVMDRIDGRPFPGLPRPLGWEALAGPTRALLEILARVHLAGVVHRDLKPGNILVDAQGQPVVLDFGIATGAALSLDRSAGPRGGTPNYLAPEQLAGGACDGRTDLYALGVLLFEALTGALPQGRGDPQAILRRRLLLPAPPLAKLAPEVPAHVAAVVDQLLARNPADRPVSALAVSEALGFSLPGVLRGRAATSLPRDRAAREEELRPLFVGPDTFLHLQEDAARQLFSRTGGAAELVADELEAWVRAGLATWQEDRLAVTRAALARLESGLVVGPAPLQRAALSADADAVYLWARLAWPDADRGLLGKVTGLSEGRLEAGLGELLAQGLVWPLAEGRLGLRPALGQEADQAWLRTAHRALAEAQPRPSAARLRHLLASNADLSLIVSEVRALGEARLAAGELEGALAVAELGLPLARRGGSGPSDELALLQLICLAALPHESDAYFDRALYSLGRATGGGGDRDALLWLVQAFRAALHGEADRALALLESVGAFALEALEIWREGVRTRALSGRGPAEEAAGLERLRGWAAGSPLRAAKLAGWRANLAYRQGRYAEAAALHQEAAAGKRGSDRLSAQSNAAAALIEAGELSAAEALAAAVAEGAGRRRIPYFEAISSWQLRVAAYRADRPLIPLPELVEAAAAVGTYPEALHAASEAAIAWRAGGRPLAFTLASRAQQVFGALGVEEARLLYGCLALAASRLKRAEVLVPLADRAAALNTPDFAVQSLGLLARATRRPRRAWLEAATAAAAAKPPAEWARRLDILSYQEALDPAIWALAE